MKKQKKLKKEEEYIERKTSTFIGKLPKNTMIKIGVC